MKAIILTGMLVLAGPAFALSAKDSLTIRTECQQNTDNNKILIVDGSLIPEGRYKINAYTPIRRDDDMWTHGPCAITFPRIPR